MKKNNNSIYSLVFILWLLFNACASTRKPVVKSTEPIKPEVKNEKPPEPKETQQKTIRMALVLPLEIKKQLALLNDTAADKKIEYTALQQLHFLEGALLACDTLNTLNVPISIQIADAPADSFALTNVFYRKEIMQADAIITSVNMVNAATAARIAQKHKHKIVFASPAPLSVLQQNTEAYLSMPSSSTQCELAVKFLLKKFPKGKIYLLTRDAKRDKEIAEVFKNKIPSEKLNYVVYTPASFDSLVKTFSQTENNTVVISSFEESFVTAILAKLNNLTVPSLTAFGLPNWEDFESIDFSQFKNIKTWYFSTNFVNHEDAAAIQFRKQFYAHYKTEPLVNAFQAYDLVLSLTEELLKIKKSEMPRMNFFPYSFKQNGSGNGFENNFINILEIKDYRVVKVE